jgi:hypothetical protein
MIFLPLYVPKRAIRLFHASATLSLLQNHKLFPKVDWERVEAGNYAVVDPVNPGVILYLSEQDYIVMVRVAITSNKTLKVLAAPGESPRADQQSPDPSQNSPTSSPWETILKLGRRTSEGQRGRSRFLNLWRSALQPFFAKRRATQSTVKGAVGISMIGLTRENVTQWFHSWHDIVSWWSRGSSLTTVQKNERKSFGLFLARILKHNGINHVIARLKIMLFVVNAYLGGRRLTSTAELGFRIRLQKGLPAALPRLAREGIRYGNKHYIHIWTSMLFSYKGIQGTWQEPHLATGSITTPHPELQHNSTLLAFETFAFKLWKEIKKLGATNPNFKVRGTFFSTHAGPNHPITILGAGIDAFLWEALDRFGFKKSNTNSKGVVEIRDIMSSDSWTADAIRQVTGVSRNYIREWLEITNQPDLWKQIRLTAKMFSLNHEVLRGVKSANDLFSIISKEGVERPMYKSSYLYRYFGLSTAKYRFRNPTLQRLHNLYEAAGKVRTIAIVDYWTNFVLKPLHDWMFDLLKLFPQDATFDQEGKVREFAGRDYKEVYSYDLKSATDLIPLALYRALFKWVFPEKVLNLWFDLLVNRNFLVPPSTVKAFPDHPVRVRYSTGQPMGALTSWASMALVHHALVLFSAVQAGVVTIQTAFTFVDYMVLGDDVVIANKAVAESYVTIMKDLRVPLSLAKSHVSDLGMFNFANQTFVKDVNVSPVSLREEINATSLPERVEMTLRMARRGWMDLASRTWVTPVVKKLLGSDVWNTLLPEIRSRIVPPVVRWALATILTPGTTRIGFAGLKSITLEICLGAMLRKADLWGFKMAHFGDLIDRHRGRELLVSILGKWVNAVYKEFLHSRKRLEEFPQWVTKVVSVDLEWLFLRVFAEARADALKRWTDTYRIPLKELQVATNLSRFSIDDIECGTGRQWDELVPWVFQAEADLPVIPDFSQNNLEALTGLQTGGIGTNPNAARESFLRVTNVLGMIDHLSASGTPGFEEAWDGFTSQSTNPLKDEVNKSP